MAMKDPKMMATMRTPQEEAVVMDGEEDEVALPGFRFHPTDEELVSFYLKRKIEKKPLSFEIIKQVDIYKHDPWDLAKFGGMVGDKEWYFYCKRGRKYKNSARPNRVTGSGGFWKATGIDRPIYDSNVEGSIVGLKKSLVYYRGIAGKGTKTDWMMHEFRLPSQSPSSSGSGSSFFHLPKQAEIWTLCRIMKRSRRHTPDWRELSSKRVSFASTKSTSNVDSAQSNNTKERYISFITPSTTIQIQPPQGQPFGDRLRRRQNVEQRIFESENTIDYATCNVNFNSSTYHDIKGHQASPLMDHQANYASEFASNFSSPLNTTSSGYDQDQVDGGNLWEDPNSVVEFAMTQL